MPDTLLITNDFGPRIGGIETFATAIVQGLGHRVVVLTRAQPGSAGHDARLDAEVVRLPVRTLLPVPAVGRLAAGLIAERGLRNVVFGAAAPLGLLAPGLREAGARRQIAISHGHEVWWAALPGSRAALRRIGDSVDVLTYVSRFTRDRLRPALSPDTELAWLPPPVDTDRFTPGPVVTAPVLIAAGRFVAQKGFDLLLRAWRQVVERWGGAESPRLRIAGEGPAERALRRAARGLPVEFVGPLPHARMPELLRTGRAFAAPMRTRLGGLNPEGFGLVLAEAAACGLPVLAGDSGGVAEVVADGVSGRVLPPEDERWAEAIARVLTDDGLAAAWGGAGRRRVARDLGRADLLARLGALLGEAPRAGP